MAGGQCSQCRFYRQNIGAGGQSFAINEDEGSANWGRLWCLGNYCPRVAKATLAVRFKPHQSWRTNSKGTVGGRVTADADAAESALLMLMMLTICWREDEGCLDRSWGMAKELPVHTTTICFNWWGGGGWWSGKMNTMRKKLKKDNFLTKEREINRYCLAQIVWIYRQPLLIISFDKCVCHYSQCFWAPMSLYLAKVFLCSPMFAHLTKVCQDRPIIDKTAKSARNTGTISHFQRLLIGNNWRFIREVCKKNCPF